MFQIYNDFENLSLDQRRHAVQSGNVNVLSLILSDHEDTTNEMSDVESVNTQPESPKHIHDDLENNGINQYTTFTSNNTHNNTFLTANTHQPISSIPPLSPILGFTTPSNQEELHNTAFCLDDNEDLDDWIGTCTTNDFINKPPRRPHKQVLDYLTKQKEPVEPSRLDFSIAVNSVA